MGKKFRRREDGNTDLARVVEVRIAGHDAIGVVFSGKSDRVVVVRVARNARYDYRVICRSAVGSQAVNRQSHGLRADGGELLPSEHAFEFCEEHWADDRRVRVVLKPPSANGSRRPSGEQGGNDDVRVENDPHLRSRSLSPLGSHRAQLGHRDVHRLLIGEPRALLGRRHRVEQFGVVELPRSLAADPQRFADRRP